MTEPIGSKFFYGNSHDHRKVYGLTKVKKLCSEKMLTIIMLANEIRQHFRMIKMTTVLLFLNPNNIKCSVLCNHNNALLECKGGE